MEKRKVDGIHDNAVISWNGRAFVTSDISDPVLYNVFFDQNLPDVTKKMLLSINETNLQGKDLGDVIPCDCLNSAAIYALKNQLFDEWRGGCESADADGCLHGELLAENVVPSCVQEAEDYMNAVEYGDSERNLLFGNLYGKKIAWRWPVEIHIDGECAKLTDLAFDAVKRIFEQMLDDECICGTW